MPGAPNLGLRKRVGEGYKFCPLGPIIAGVVKTRGVGGSKSPPRVLCSVSSSPVLRPEGSGLCTLTLKVITTSRLYARVWGKSLETSI